MTRAGVPWGFSSDKLLQVQSPKNFFCHSNVPIWRQASALWVLQSCFYALFIPNVCCLNLDSVVFHSDVCLASFLFFSNVCCERFHLADRRHQRHISSLRHPFPPQTTAQLVSLADFFLLPPRQCGAWSQATPYSPSRSLKQDSEACRSLTFSFSF